MIDPAYGAADLHIHTTYSDGAPSPAMVVARAVRLGLSVIAITDHDRIDGAIEGSLCDPARCEVVIGEEVTTHQGHVLGLFLTRAVPPGLDVEQTIDEIHAQGGLAIPAHPYLRLGGARGVGAGAAGLPWDAIEVENGSPGAWLANRQARRAQGAWARAQTGGSDSHILAAVGSVVTAFPGRTAVDLRAALESGTTRAERRNRSPLVGAQTLTRSVLRRLSGEADRERARRAYR
ncbi:MAG: PHP domain-containing protein [Chloroflexi bacterium]|nr:MAG: PHP domain-containing protein [Chloroflexota bacterium]